MAIYYEKPIEKKDECYFKITGVNGKSLWFTSDEWLKPKEIYSDEDEMPEEIKQMLPKWRAAVDKLKENFEPQWFTKLASVKFVYKDKHYKLIPAAIGATQEMYDFVHRTIEKDLIELGAVYTFYTGMLD